MPGTCIWFFIKIPVLMSKHCCVVSALAKRFYLSNNFYYMYRIVNGAALILFQSYSKPLTMSWTPGNSCGFFFFLELTLSNFGGKECQLLFFFFFFRFILYKHLDLYQELSRIASLCRQTVYPTSQAYIRKVITLMPRPRYNLVQCSWRER